jgi:dCMP deaminase
MGRRSVRRNEGNLIVARPNWPEYFMKMAHLTAERSTCDRKHVGAVIVRANRVLTTGYNGSLKGQPHCDDVGHDLVKLADGSENCVRTVHAELNAISHAARYGVSLAGAELYVNTLPCWNCFKAVVSAGIERIIFDADYRPDPRVAKNAQDMSIVLLPIGAMVKRV